MRDRLFDEQPQRLSVVDVLTGPPLRQYPGPPRAEDHNGRAEPASPGASPAAPDVIAVAGSDVGDRARCCTSSARHCAFANMKGAARMLSRRAITAGRKRRTVLSHSR